MSCYLSQSTCTRNKFQIINTSRIFNNLSCITNYTLKSSWETNKSINFIRGFYSLSYLLLHVSALFLPSSRSLRVPNWVTCTFWIVVDKSLHDGWRWVLKSDVVMCCSLVRSAAYCIPKGIIPLNEIYAFVGLSQSYNKNAWCKNHNFTH
jgi:hypothetical protein